MPTAARRTRASRYYIAAAVIASVAIPVACHKEPAAPPLMQVAGNTTLATNSTVATSVAGVPFSFPGGAGAISPSVAGQNLTVTFGGTAAATTATLLITPTSGGGGGTVTANVTFGSCIFAVAAITGTVGSLRVGDTITVNPCNMNVNTTGAVANGVATSRSVALVLGAASSAGATITVGVNPGGQLTLNGTQVGTVTLVPVSG